MRVQKPPGCVSGHEKMMIVHVRKRSEEQGVSEADKVADGRLYNAIMRSQMSSFCDRTLWKMLVMALRPFAALCLAAETLSEETM